MRIRTREDLTNYVNRGKKVKYLFFWGHQAKGNTITTSCFSQWFTSPFTEAGMRFATAEHYMMFRKAKLFNDNDAMGKALNAKNPGAVKAVGRSVKSFDQSVWDVRQQGLVMHLSYNRYISQEEN